VVGLLLVCEELGLLPLVVLWVGERRSHLLPSLLELILELELELDVVDHVRDSRDRERSFRSDEIWKQGRREGRKEGKEG